MDPNGAASSLVVVEDDDALATYLADNLSADGFRVACARSAAEGVRAIESRRPDLVILDVKLGDGSGLMVLDRVRTADGIASRIDAQLPVIVLSGRTSEADRVRGFARGADDYVVKPFAYAELLARVRALLRRAAGRPRRAVVRVGELSLDPSTREVRLAGQPVVLAAKEFALLHTLATDPTRVHLKNDLLRDVWGGIGVATTRTLLQAEPGRSRRGRRAVLREWASADSRRSKRPLRKQPQPRSQLRSQARPETGGRTSSATYLGGQRLTLPWRV